MKLIDYIFQPDMVALAVFVVMLTAWSLSKLIQVEKNKGSNLKGKIEENNNV